MSSSYQSFDLPTESPMEAHCCLHVHHRACTTSVMLNWVCFLSPRMAMNYQNKTLEGYYLERGKGRRIVKRLTW